MCVIRSLFSWNDLETLICGKSKLDVKALRALANFTASTTTDFLWEVLDSFTVEEQSKFLRFVTGYSRVPLEGVCMSVYVEKCGTSIFVGVNLQFS